MMALKPATEGVLARRIAYIALLAFVFSMPWESGVPTLYSGSISRILGLIAMALGLIAVVTRRGLRVRPLSLFLILALVFTAFGGLSAFWSIRPTVSAVSTAKYVQLVAMVWLIHEFVRDRRGRDALMQAYVLGGFVTVGFGLWTFFTLDDSNRSVGTGNANEAAMLMAIGIPMAVTLMFRAKSRMQFFVNLLFIPCALMIDVLTASRGGLLTALTALLTIPVLLGSMRPVRRALLTIAFVAAGWSLYILAPKAFPTLQENLGRLGETTEQLESGTLTYRRLIWDAGLKVFQDQPVVGVGLGGYRYAIVPYYGSAQASHNSYLSVLIDLGLVGFSMWLIMILVAFLPSLSVAGNQRWFNLIFILTLMVGIAPLEVEDRKQIWLVFTLLAMERAIFVRSVVPTWIATRSHGFRTPVSPFPKVGDTAVRPDTTG